MIYFVPLGNEGRIVVNTADTERLVVNTSITYMQINKEYGKNREKLS